MTARRSPSRGNRRAAGFTLLPVVLAMTLVGALAFLLNRDNAVNARMITSRADLERARYAAEAGLQAANYRVQQLGCGGGYPTSAFPVADGFAGGSYSAHADRATGYPVALTSTGTYNGASVTLARSNVLVYQAGVRSTTLQPGPAAALDTYLNAILPTRNYGTSSNLQLWVDRYEILLKFDLSSLPAGSRIVPWHDGTALQRGATLSLYQTNAPVSTGSIGAYLMTRSWVEGTGSGGATGDGATWNAYDGVNAWPAGRGYDPRPVATADYSASTGWKSWDVSGAAVAWTGGLYANDGVAMRVASGSINSVQYVSSDDAVNAARWPRLAVNYLAPCSSATTVTLASVADAYIDSSTIDYTNYRNYGTSPYLAVHWTSSRQVRTLVRFDLSTLPAGATITSARLRLYATAVYYPTPGQKTAAAYALTQSWVEGTNDGAGYPTGVSYSARDGDLRSWSTYGGSYRTPRAAMAVEEATDASPPPGSFRTGWVYWDLTPLAREWASGSTANHGVILISTVSDVPVFASRQDADPARRPQLVVTYQ